MRPIITDETADRLDAEDDQDFNKPLGEKVKYERFTDPLAQFTLPWGYLE